MRHLHGTVQNYAWGSPTAISDLLGHRPTGHARRGAVAGHPSAGTVGGQRQRTRARRDAPARVRATDVVGELPFLLKVLAADKALSLQVHPDLAMARAGFAAEDAAGVPHDAPHRRYRDPNHKPELIVALTPFRALAASRAPGVTLAIVGGLGDPRSGRRVRATGLGPGRRGRVLAGADEAC